MCLEQEFETVLMPELPVLFFRGKARDLKNEILPHCKGGKSAVVSAGCMWAAVLVQHVCFPFSLEGFES